jgi:hypothetical protein
MGFGAASVALWAVGVIMLGALIRLIFKEAFSRRTTGILQVGWPQTPTLSMSREPRRPPHGFPEPGRRSPFLRDPEVVFLAYPERCDLIFWKPSRRQRPDERIVDFVTGSSGLYSVAADCGWQVYGQVYVATCSRRVSRKHRVDGPHFADQRTCPATFARVQLNEVLDPTCFRAALERPIANRVCRHKTPRNFVSYICGTTPADRLTCSGLIGRAVLEQPDSAFGSALRRVLERRFHYGEIAPSDLMQAAILMNLPVEGCTLALVRISMWERISMWRTGATWRTTG